MEDKTVYRFDYDDYFLNQLKRMNNSLKELGDIIDANNRALQVGRPPQYVVHQHQWRRVPQQPTPAPAWPFSLLALGIDGTLTRCDQAIGWFVKRVIGRWMQCFLSWQRNRRHF